MCHLSPFFGSVSKTGARWSNRCEFKTSRCTSCIVTSCKQRRSRDKNQSKRTSEGTVTRSVGASDLVGLSPAKPYKLTYWKPTQGGDWEICQKLFAHIEVVSLSPPERWHVGQRVKVLVKVLEGCELEPQHVKDFLKAENLSEEKLKQKRQWRVGITYEYHLLPRRFNSQWLWLTGNVLLPLATNGYVLLG